MEAVAASPGARRREVAVNQSAQSLRVDRNSPVPLYFQVAQHLEHLIESGEMPTGTRLENEIDLADQLGLSRPTMRRAIQYLVDRGLLVRKRGVGTQVVQAKVRRQIELTSLHDAGGRGPPGPKAGGRHPGVAGQGAPPDRADQPVRRPGKEPAGSVDPGD